MSYEHGILGENCAAFILTFFFPCILSPSIEQRTKRATHLTNTNEDRVNTKKLNWKMSRINHGSSAVSLTRKINSLQKDKIKYKVKEYQIERKQCKDSRIFASNF